MSNLLTLVHEDAAAFMRDPGTFDLAMCLGAAGVLGGFGQAAAALRATVPTDGHVVIGDLYRHDGTDPDPGDDPPQWLVDAVRSAVPLTVLLDGMVRSRLAPVSVLPSSDEDWMTYSSLMWLSVEDWLAENFDHSDAPREPERSYTADLRQHQLGWALIAGRRSRDLEEQQA